MTRPSCVVRVDGLPTEKRPRFTHGEGVRSEVRAVGDTTGLTRMGVWVRSFEPRFAGTNRHYHEVEEEWAYVLSGAGVVRRRTRAGTWTRGAAGAAVSLWR